MFILFLLPSLPFIFIMMAMSEKLGHLGFVEKSARTEG